MNPLDRAYKRLMKDSREYLSDIVKKYNRAGTEKERALRVLLTYRHYFSIAAKLCSLHSDFEDGKFEGKVGGISDNVPPITTGS